MDTKTALVPMEALERFAQAFASSGMFGTKTKEQALSLLLLAQAEGVHPAIAMRDFDIINNRPAKKAQAMHRSFLEAGGKIEWHERTDTRADATFSHQQGGSVRVTWDMERARKAGLGSKDMYGKYARQMLSARVISEGCRTVYPAATSGMYVPEEVRHFEPKPTPEKDMGAAHQVADEDITTEIPMMGTAAPQVEPSSSPETPAAAASSSTRITAEKAAALRTKLQACDKFSEETFLKIAKIAKLEDLLDADHAEALDWIARRAKKFGKAA